MRILRLALVACCAAQELAGQGFEPGQKGPTDVWFFAPSRDSFTGADQSGAMVKVVNGDKMAAVVFRCDGHGSLEVSVTTGAFLGLHDSRPVRWRVDPGGAVHDEGWNPSTTGTWVFYPSDVGPFVEALKAGTRLLFEVTDYERVTHQVTFPLRGFTRAYARLACRP